MSVLSPRHPISVPSRRLGLIAYVPCVAIRPASRAVIRLPLLVSSPRPFDTIDGAEATGRPTACSTERRTERAVSSWLSCVHAAACPMRASDRPMPCRSSVSPPLARSVSSWRRRSLVSVMPAFQSPRLIDTRDGERGGADACSAVRIGRCASDEKKRAGRSFPVRLFRFYRV